MNQTFNELRLEQHPDKTLIGKTERGFDFLGYHFSLNGLTLAKKTIINVAINILQLYEQDSFQKMRQIGEYLKRWNQWVIGGLNKIQTRTIDNYTKIIIELWLCTTPSFESYYGQQGRKK